MYQAEQPPTQEGANDLTSKDFRLDCLKYH